MHPVISHLSQNCKLDQPISALAKLLKDNKLSANEMLKGEFIFYFEKYLKKCIQFVMSDIKNMIDFYLWYRDSNFYLDWKGGKVNFKSYLDYEQFIYPRLINQSRHTTIHRFYDEFIARIEKHIGCNVIGCTDKKTKCSIHNKKAWLKQKFGNFERHHAVLYSALISIGRTIDILSISVTKSDKAKQNFINTWSRNASLNEMDPLYDIFNTDTASNKEAQNEIVKFNKQGVTLLKQVYQSMPYLEGVKKLETALINFRLSRTKNITSGSFLSTQIGNCITCLVKSDLLTLPKYSGNFWRIFRKLKNFWRIFEKYGAFLRILSIFGALLGQRSINP